MYMWPPGWLLLCLLDISYIMTIYVSTDTYEYCCTNTSLKWLFTTWSLCTQQQKEMALINFLLIGNFCSHIFTSGYEILVNPLPPPPPLLPTITLPTIIWQMSCEAYRRERGVQSIYLLGSVCIHTCMYPRTRSGSNFQKVRTLYNLLHSRKWVVGDYAMYLYNYGSHRIFSPFKFCVLYMSQ